MVMYHEICLEGKLFWEGLLKPVAASLKEMFDEVAIWTV
jgi:hypothetical protein